MLGTVLLLQLSGINLNMNQIWDLTGITFTSNNTINKTEPSASTFYGELFDIGSGGSGSGLLSALLFGAAAFAVVALAGVRGENLILTPLVVGTLVLFLQTMVGIMSQIIATGNTWVTGIIILILFPFSIGFILALVEWWRGGTD